MKTYTLKFSGDADTLDAAMLALAELNGWTPLVADEDGTESPNPQQPLDVARRAITRYVRESVQARLIQQASEQAAAAAKTTITAELDTLTAVITGE